MYGPEDDGRSLSQRLDAIGLVQSSFMRDTARFLQPGTPHTQVDWLLMAATKRSLSLSQAFVDLIKVRNFQAAAPFIRMQLDTCLRVVALLFVDDPEEMANAIFSDVPLRTLRDRTGKRLHDARLVELVSEQVPWVKPVYEDSSSFIHLTARHLWTCIVDTDDATRTVRWWVSARDPELGEERYYDAVDSFSMCLTLTRTNVVGIWKRRLAGLPLSVARDDEKAGPSTR